MRIKIVFWDWVGTLVSSKMLSNIYLENLIARKEITENLDVSNLSLQDVEKLRVLLKQYEEAFIPFSWFLVKKFHENGIKQVIVSNGNDEVIKKKLLTAPYNYFDLILASNKFLPKPNIEMFQFAAKKFKVEEKFEMIMIGDSSLDKEAAKNFDIDFYLIDDTLDSTIKIAKQFNFI